MERGFLCNHCFARICPPTPRFHCSECSGFDLCLDCVKLDIPHRQDHPDHRLLEEVEFDDVLRGQVCAKGNVYGILEAMFRAFSHRPCLGKLVRGGEINQIPILVEYMSFREVYESVLRVGSGLRALGLTEGEMLALVHENSVEWVIIDLACALFRIPTVPISSFLSINVIAEILNDCEAIGVFCDNGFLKAFQSSSVKCPKIRYLLVSDLECSTDHSAKDNLFSFESLLAWGVRSPSMPRQGPGTDIFTLVYTSGSSGRSKGAIFTFEIWSAFLRTIYAVPDPLVYAAFAPLSHLADRKGIYYTLVNGGRVTVSTPGPDIFASFGVVRPSYIQAVPRVWSVLYQLCNVQIEENRHAGMPEAHARSAAYEKVWSLVGNRVRRITTGGASTPPHIMKFLRDCFGPSSVRDGYGTTEVGSIAGNGEIVNSATVRLESWPEGGFFVTDCPNPRGELLVKTRTTIAGYYNNEELTRNAFDVDGYFRTGDIVEQLPDGHIKIIERKSNFFKLLSGEFVSPVALEEVLMTVPGVRQVAICRNADHSAVCAVIARSSDTVTREELEVEFCKLSLLPFELPREILFSEPFTAENGLLTPSGKICRPAISSLAINRDVKGDGFLAVVAECLGRSFESLKAVLGTSPMLSLSELGADSVAGIALKRQLHVDIDMKDLLSNPVLSLEEKSDDVPLALADAAFVNAVDVLRRKAANDSNGGPVVVLTGATGFLGIHLCVALCERGFSVAVLVRGSLDAAARRFSVRLPHVAVFPADLEKEKCGLDANDWNRLVGTAICVVHCGALVNHVFPYKRLRGPNVIGTRSMLQLAAEAQVPLVFVSSTSVFSSATVLDEALIPCTLATLSPITGYGRTKVVAETMVERQAETVIVRFGRIGPHSKSGVWNESDTLLSMLRVADTIGFTMQEGYAQRIVAVDAGATFVANIVRKMLDGKQFPKVVHALRTETVRFSELSEWFTGHKLKRLPYPEWLTRARLLGSPLDVRVSAFPGRVRDCPMFAPSSCESEWGEKFARINRSAVRKTKKWVGGI